jgi:cathepsin B
MKAVAVSAALLVAASASVHPDRAAQIEKINNAEGVLWKAAAHPRFASEAPGASKDLCGVKNISDQANIIKKLIELGEIEEFLGDSNAAVPDNFDSEQNWPQCAKIIGDIRDQSNCGCCWAFAGAEAGSDRMCISTNASIMVPLSAQDVCFNGGGFMSMGCNGGQITSPWSYLKKGGLFGGKGAVSGGQYQGTGPFGKGLCSDFSLPHCHHHGPKGDDPYPAEGEPGCPHDNSPKGPKACDADAKAPHNNFEEDKYGYNGQTITARGEMGIKQAIMAGGPMEVAFTVYSDFENYASGIYHHTGGSMAGGHAVKVVGWGVENGVKYWKIANSWNPYWGEKGYFRIRVGECGIDDQAVASSPTAKWSRAGDVSKPQGVDCSTSKCPSQCQCVQSKCADSINACLPDAQCAKSESCAMSCACGDKACAITCELANPSPKATAVAQCALATCATSDIVV